MLDPSNEIGRVSEVLGAIKCDYAVGKPMLSKGIRQFSTGNHDIKNVLQCFDVKFRVSARNSVVAFETRQNY
jgi:hypothetical protein